MLTITTKRRCISSEPRDEEELRLWYAVMTNICFSAQLRKSGRFIYKDLERNTHTDFLETLLGCNKFNLHTVVDGCPVLVPKCTDGTSCEFELRNQTIRLCREEAWESQTPSGAALADKEHRMINWVQLISIANSSGSRVKQRMETMEKTREDLE